MTREETGIVLRDDISIIVKEDREVFIDEYNSFLDTHKNGYLLVVSPNDTFEKKTEGMDAAWKMAQKLAHILDENESAVIATPKKLFQFPNRLCGVMIRVEKLHDIENQLQTKLRLKKTIQYSFEAEFLLKLMDYGQFIMGAEVEYVQGDPGDGNFREFEGIYDKNWYMGDMNQFLLPLLSDYSKQGGIPYYAQFYAMYYIKCRLDANKNNANRHVLSGDEIDKFKAKIIEVLQYIDDDIIMNARRYPVYIRDYQFSRMLLRLKYETEKLNEKQNVIYRGIESEEELAESLEDADEYHHTIGVRYPALFIMQNGIPYYSSSRLRCNIQFMDYRDGNLEIDGSFPDIFDKEKIDYYFVVGDKKYRPVWCDRYSLIKFFGESAYKRFPFHATIPIDEVMNELDDDTIRFCIAYDGNEYEIAFEFKSHTSRLAAYPKNTYWHFGEYLALTKQQTTPMGGNIVTGIRIVKYNWFKMAGKELGIGTELLTSFKMHRFRFFLLRAAWVATSPYFAKKNIWMFFDKIYKGGDSSEYLYKYAENIRRQEKGKKEKGHPDKLYYLLDESTTDYKRLKEEGYKPLKRGSFIHRLVFLNANYMIVSNSTVFAFNDYYLENSRYIRGIVDFHTVCVQHGLSVQKIALAQQRLRDNTRLYFCASKYEIENLMHPVYDYVGYDALKLTGVPRYDGLENRDKKQIMISPTWRMQSAMLVSKNEGVERDYNPFFKDTDYFKVYNALINDKKLIKAAEEYGYRIAYVLHPIVSPQAGDFDSNDYVDIIPSVGDMSYEKMFCESSLMVTDYSGIQFDFAYMRKPLVYYHPEELEAHYEEGTYHYDTMAFGEIVRKKDELVSLLIDYMKNGCEMKQLYKMRADDFFAFDDRNNCKRIYEELIKAQ